jgi:hypothetical protein
MFFLKRAGRFRAHAAGSLANAEAASDVATWRAHLAMARHFYALAEQEISQREAKRLDRPGHFRDSPSELRANR